MMRTSIIMVIAVCIAFSTCALAKENPRRFALEAQYGAANTTLLPLNQAGEVLYGSPIATTPLSGRLIWAASHGLNLGLAYSSSIWTSTKTFSVGGSMYSSVKLTMISITPFIDLSPYMFGENASFGITKGMFFEVGPGFTTLAEEYFKNGSSSAFSCSGYSLDFMLGFRTLNGEPLAFVALTKFSIPLSSDLKISETGVSLNGAATISANVGICFTI